MVHLGFMELPLSGPFNFAIASGGMLMGIVVSILCYQLSELTGPALPLGGAEALKARGFLGFGDDGGDVLTIEAAVDGFAKACRVPMLATVSWSVVYYNMLGTSVNGMCAVHIFKMIPPDKVTPDWSNISSRFSGNMAPVFLTSLWLYTIFVDAGSAGVLGLALVVQRLVYPFFYMVQGKFTFWFEFVTQPGYGINGCLMLGVIVTVLGGDWVSMVKASPYLMPFYGWVFGSFTLFPGLPFAPAFAFLHYKIFRALHAPDPKASEDESKAMV